MKIRFIFLLLAVYGCQTKTKNSNSTKIEIDIPVQKKLKTEHRKFFVGDINHDNIYDTAYVNYTWNIETNDIQCEEKNCDIHIEFNKDIPNISFAQSLGIVVKKTEDINEDKANEIIVFSRTNEGWWNKISVWTYKNKSWKMIAETDALISDNKDFENRIIHENGKYYLIDADRWNEDEKGDFKKVKLEL